ncbi:MAG: hypothetical protein SGARI_001913, partial [Bacillariaceae sp.]
MASLMKKIRKKLRKLSNKKDGSKSPSADSSTGSVTAPGSPPRKEVVANKVVAKPTVPRSSSSSSPAKKQESIVPPPSLEKKSTLANPTGLILKEAAASPTKVVPKKVVESNDETFVDSSFVVIHRHNNAKEETKEEMALISYSVKGFSPAAVPARDDASTSATARRFPMLVWIIIATMVVAASVGVVAFKENHHVEYAMESFRSMLPASWTSEEPTKWNLWPTKDLSTMPMEPSPAVPHNDNIPTVSEPIWNMLANPTAFDTRQVTEPSSLTTLIESLEPYVYSWQQEEDTEEPKSSYFATVTTTVKSYWTTAKDAVGHQPQVQSSLQALEPYWTSMTEHLQSASEY